MRERTCRVVMENKYFFIISLYCCDSELVGLAQGLENVLLKNFFFKMSLQKLRGGKKFLNPIVLDF